MAPYRRRKIGASRRRREDEGEDEGSTPEELEDDSLSDGSVVSNQDDDDADGEGSEASEDDSVDRTNGHVNGVHEAGAEKGRSPSPGKRVLASTLSDTEAMMNGIKISDQDGQVAEIQFDDLKEEDQDDKGDTQTGRTPSESKRETFAERKRREHEEYLKARDENPALVPTRGGFFLHERRSTEPDTNGHRPFRNRSKSRPHGLIVDGTIGRYVDPSCQVVFF